jgi:hypothetical protein
MTLPVHVLPQAAVGHGHGISVSRKAERGGCGGESKTTHRRGDVSSSSMVGTVAPIDGATLPVLVGGCHRVMRPEEVAHLAHRLGNQVLGTSRW